MGQTSSNPTEGDTPMAPLTQRLPPALLKMSERAPLHCVFHYEDKEVRRDVALPLVYAKSDDDPIGTRMMDLELWLREQFQLPTGSSVFAVIPAQELYSPPFPLVMINTVAQTLQMRFEPGNEPEVHYALVVLSMSILRQPVVRNDAVDSPYYPISAALLSQKEPSVAREFAYRRFAQNMMRFGFARIEVTPEQAKIPQDAFTSVRKWLMSQLALPTEQRWRDKVDARSTEEMDAASSHPKVSGGRYVGFSADRSREYLQLRRPIAASGTVWPPAYFADNKQFATEMLTLLNLLDNLGRDCMRAICEILNLDEDWIMKELLDDPTPPPASEEEVTTVDKSYQYGASVLRIYNYRNKSKDGAPVNPEDQSCATHADLGLVTVSPVATVPGLQMWNLERMVWTDVEGDAGPLHFSVFAGETLGFITNGLVRAPLHRVPAIGVPTEDGRRMSMPYFLRARPEACLNPRATPTRRITCRDFMEDIVFKNRPWRREDPKSPAPDY
ncbi:hypothetical protein Poli38472_009019 [Pythium oligandrum]|uniref:Fe2OG dioxygenase domain-containing protein n=1 Tax=Pythium oligandrum TaxID=41045 RepID=A0A8K1CJY7_PYTOL|nr:hypothetical protein Poli38472_009019 [Pythium oligandrum]|eukprot:TMW64852.1 hypothetical protein Poli38472_009019 [Pythium oligandrum]